MNKQQIFVLIYLNIFFLLNFSYNIAAESSSAIEIHARSGEQNGQGRKVKILLGVVADTDHILDNFINRLAKNLEFNGQLEISKKSFDTPRNKKEVTDLFEQGYPLIIFINYFDKDNALEWRLYDATQAEMVKGKKYGRTSAFNPRWAHGIAQDVWPDIAQESGIFLTKIAYVKKIQTNGRNKYRSQICIADFDGTHEKILLDMPTIYVELAFHPDTSNPRLLVSEFTQEGSRLLMLDFNGNKKVVLAGDKSISGASLSNHGQKAIYKESGDIWKYNFNTKTGSARHELVVKKRNKCSSATLCPNDDIIYCSDGRIYRHEASTGNCILIVDDGIAPAYCAITGRFAYSKRHNGILQIMLMDEKTGKTRQVTFDKGHKSDACFSPCGNYILFCHEKGTKKYIECLVIATGKRHKITSSEQYCAYPAWSPVYPDLLP